MISANITSPAAVLPKAAHMRAEVEEGNVEYKYTLTNLSEEQLAHRITQLNWRLNEGSDEAVYKIGVRDDGYPVGLSAEDLEESLGNLRRMSAALQCDVRVTQLLRGSVGTVAEVHFRRRLSGAEAPLQLDVAVAGESGAGKSTLIAVLLHGEPDNGRGAARMLVFKHNHELACGHTSSTSQHLLFLGHDGQVLKPNSLSASGTGGRELLRSGDPRPRPGPDGAAAEEGEETPSHSGERRLRALSEEDVLREALRSVCFIDLAGHERFLKTALHGMVGRAPQFCLLAVSAAAGPGCIGQMTREHLALASAMRLELIVVVTKADLAADDAALQRSVDASCAVLRACGVEGAPVRSEAELGALLASQRPEGARRRAPVFAVSSVSGLGLGLLRQYLSRVPVPAARRVGRALPPPGDTDEALAAPSAAGEEALVLILDHFRIDPPEQASGGERGPAQADSLSPSAALRRLREGEEGAARAAGPSSVLILYGSVQAGAVAVGDKLLYGPDARGRFSALEVYSIHVSRVSLQQVAAGRCACFAVREVVPEPEPLSGHATIGLATDNIADVASGSEDSPDTSLKIALPAVGCNTPPLRDTAVDIRKELRIRHDNDPRRRRLRVDDPEHPSNRLVAPTASSAPPAGCQKIAGPGCGADAGPLSWPVCPGMVLVSPNSHPTACIEFDANILVLNHPKSISVNYEPVVHGLGTKQCAKIISIRKLLGGEDGGPVEAIRNGERALCRFRFLYRPEFLPRGTDIVLREGRTRAVGVVTATQPLAGGAGAPDGGVE